MTVNIAGVSVNSVYIAMPAFGRMNCTETTMSLVSLPTALASRGIRYCFTTQTWTDIAELRDMMLTLWYDRLVGYSHMLMVDADMGFKPELVLDMFAFDKPVVGCLYPKKTNPINYVGRGKPGKPRIDRGFIEVDGVGAGVLLVKREAVTTMLERGVAKSDDRIATHAAGPMLKEWGVKRIIRAFEQIETPTGKLSEDLSFCRRHTDCGGQVWAAGHHRITHVGPYGFSGRFLDGYEHHGEAGHEPTQEGASAHAGLLPVRTEDHGAPVWSTDSLRSSAG